MSERSRAWSAGVWASAPPPEAPTGSWPCVRFFEVVPNLLQATVEPGSIDGVPKTNTLHRPELVRAPTTQLTVGDQSTEIEHPALIQVHIPVGARLVRIGKSVLYAMQALNLRLGVRWIYETDIHMDTGLIGRAAVLPSDHLLELNTDEGFIASPPVSSQAIVMAELRAGLAYTFDNPHPDGSCHDSRGFVR